MIGKQTGKAEDCSQGKASADNLAQQGNISGCLEVLVNTRILMPMPSSRIARATSRASSGVGSAQQVDD